MKDEGCTDAIYRVCTLAKHDRRYRADEVSKDVVGVNSKGELPFTVYPSSDRCRIE